MLVVVVSATGSDRVGVVSATAVAQSRRRPHRPAAAGMLPAPKLHALHGYSLVKPEPQRAQRTSKRRADSDTPIDSSRSRAPASSRSASLCKGVHWG